MPCLQVIEQRDVNVFRRQMERFVDSSNSETTGDGALWPVRRPPPPPPPPPKNPPPPNAKHNPQT